MQYVRPFLCGVALFFGVTPTWAYMFYYRPDEPIQVPFNNSSGFLLDLDFNGIVDATLLSNGSDFFARAEDSNELLALGSSVVPLSYGEAIGSSPENSASWEGGTSYFSSCQNSGGTSICIGLWATAETSDAYFGLQFDIDGQTHYGWVHLINTFFVTGHITEWAYATEPGVPVFAGVVPEPATILLLLFGGLGIAFTRSQCHGVR